MNKIFIGVINVFMVFFLISNTVYASEPNYSLGEALLKLILYMIIVIFVLALTIFATRFLARNSQKFIKSKYMKIVDMLNIGTNAKILMVEIEDYVYTIVITNNSAELIEKVKRDELIRDSDFEDMLNRHALSYKSMDKIRKVLNRNHKFNDEEDEDEI